MGLFVSERARQDGRATFAQLIGGVIAFVVLSVVGGILVAGLALPVVTVAGNSAEGASDLFEELPGELESVTLPQQSNIYDRTGQKLIATFYSQNRVVVPLEDISPWIQKAVVAVEDQRFWEHNGVDGEGILRAVYTTVTTEGTQGGSTLTQQLVKNTILQKAIDSGDEEAIAAATETSVERKIREWRLALAYEEKVNDTYGTVCSEDPGVDCGKEQILEQYLNIAQFGTNTYGVEAAAQYYFSKSAAELNALEAATIAGITQNPTKWDPIRNPEQSMDRRNIVLLRMEQQGLISTAEYDEYVATTFDDYKNISYPKFSCRASDIAPFFCDYVTKVIKQDEAFRGEGTDLLYSGGLDIITTLDVSKQWIANQELKKSLPYDDPSGWAMALVSLDSSTGQILAMSQTREFDPTNEAPNSTSINYATDRDYGGSRGFSPGSTFKPIILTTWLESGRSLNQTVSASIREYDLSDWTASCLDGNLTGTWKPTNVGGRGGTSMTVLNATANSINTAYVAMSSQLDLCDVVDVAEKLGFHRADGKDMEYLPSITLGTQNASPLTMASVMQTYANDGVHCEPYAILSITDANGDVPVGSDGEEIVPPVQNCNRVLSEEIAVGVQFAMSKVIEYGSGTRAELAGGRQAAGKTGTSQLNAHLWFVGYTPQLTTAVWLGNPDQDEKGYDITLNGVNYNNQWIYGGTISAPTWKRYMDKALEDEPNIDFIQTPSNEIMYGTPQDIPNLIGMSESQARYALAQAGFRAQARTVYSNLYSPGTVAGQAPSANSKALPGATISYYLATDQRPDWWYRWPSSWDPSVAPDDYWGGTWPPSEFSTNPPDGWPVAEEPDNNGNGRGNGNNQSPDPGEEG
ncbi:penicillin-binding protein [Demequina zhanjiangensis]|uniref:Penicillin-binding protein n=1 Tax=Demequina zhanjiangensis TaxID=3051659 RepID=A0ABT8G5B8_9MICO|nr:penicillin-binding protein [Demequina sp. SYSU T00b26]MDN4473914.1 penicillin-binding protein [Demequina sp. SYSU T00b26]